LARRMHDRGESAGTIASALGVSRATVYRVLAEQAD
jgi:predicted transcriptional regulator